MSTIVNIILFVVILGIIVAVHELGHLIFAKRAKILCFEYAIGMGPVLYRKKNKETDFSIRAIPIGGFVSMAGEQMSTAMIREDQTIGINLKDGIIKEIVLNLQLPYEQLIKVTEFEIYDEKETGDLFIEGYVNNELVRYPISEEAYYHVSEKEQLKIAPYKRSFESKTYIQKLLTLIAGPGMNFLLALLLFFIIASFQGKPLNNNVVGGTVEGFPAHVAGLNKGDKIINIDGYDVTDQQTLHEGINKLNSYENVEFIIELPDGTNKTVYLDLMVDINQIGVANYNKNKELKLSNNGAIIGQAFGNSVGDKNNPLLLENDIIKKITYNGETILINDWQDLRDAVYDLNIDGKTVTFEVLRGTEIKDVKVEAWENKVLNSQNVPAASVTIGITADTKYNFLYTLYAPFLSIGDSFMQVVKVLGLLFGGSKQIGLRELSGPVGIFNIIGQVREQGVFALLWFAAFLSVNVGMLNLLPIPVLDGGRVVFITIEAITGKRIPRKVENIIINVFFFIMMGLFVFVTFNDIWKMIFK